MWLGVVNDFTDPNLVLIFQSHETVLFCLKLYGFPQLGTVTASWQ